MLEDILTKVQYLKKVSHNILLSLSDFGKCPGQHESLSSCRLSLSPACMIIFIVHFLKYFLTVVE